MDTCALRGPLKRKNAKKLTFEKSYVAIHSDFNCLSFCQYQAKTCKEPGKKYSGDPRTEHVWYLNCISVFNHCIESDLWMPNMSENQSSECQLTL